MKDALEYMVEKDKHRTWFQRNWFTVLLSALCGVTLGICIYLECYQ